MLMNNHMPVVRKMQEQLDKARRSGDMLGGKLVNVHTVTGTVSMTSVLWNESFQI